VSSPAPVVETTSGALRGRVEDGVEVFLGVRYAAPPVGPRRFRPPEPLPRPSGIVDATRPGPSAPQPPSRLTAALGPMRMPEQDEDCLTLNVWAPTTSTAPLPVLVWLHGGAFLAGSGAQTWYDGARLARGRGIVVVTLNYRLGALGFLHLPTADGWTANAGLHDQLAALRWVRDNVAGFGGDPAQVTLAGQSAGAQSILALLRHNRSAAPFDRAILASAPLGLAPLNPEAAAERAELLLGTLGLTSAQHDRMTRVDVATLVAAQVAVSRDQARPFQLGPVFQLVADDDLVPADLLSPGPAGREVVLTSTAHEADAFTVPDPRVQAMDRAAVEAALRPLLGDATGDRYTAHSRRHPSSGPPRIGGDLTTEHFFHRDLEPLATALRAGGDTVHTHQFDWYPPDSPLRAGHCIDLPFMFGNLDAWRGAPILDGADTATLISQVEPVRRALRLPRVAPPQPEAWDGHRSDGDRSTR
jgi:para-nitrobenzyl esterase